MTSLSFAQVDDDVGEQLRAQHQIAHPCPLVRPMEVAVEAGQGAPEGHAPGNVVDVGAAAGGQALPLEAGVLLVPPQGSYPSCPIKTFFPSKAKPLASKAARATFRQLSWVAHRGTRLSK